MEAARERRNIASAQLKKGRSGIEECQLSGATLYYVGACGPDPCRNELQLEGVIAERKSSLEPGTRNGAWLKYKINRSQECYWRLHPWHQSIDALIVGCYEGADLKFVAKVRNGFVPRLRRAVFQRFAGLESDACPFSNLLEKRRTMWALTAQDMKECHWLRPRLVAQIEFTEWTPDGHLRHASFARCGRIKSRSKSCENTSLLNFASVDR